MLERNETPAEKAKAVMKSFEAKVAILERWAREGVPGGQSVPKDRTALRAWMGPDGDLRPWSDPNIDKELVGKYPDLTKRYLTALANIQKRHAAKGNRLKEVEADAAEARTRAENLEMQNATLIGINDALQRRIKTLLDLLAANGIEAPL
ncbi:hypothetical protein [Rhodovastum atsumiense]|uniref:Uncharacterized protein n=1 Tax=Rhodovastum atsumiense TaxID=504468 RepID=A0A5M6IM19_9PROT|nr:hypothetical protein [Rhodovastum atsumiense]KAA5608608.1 hypothetical protein F1189_28220 [Rhodovastum atsumiense]